MTTAFPSKEEAENWADLAVSAGENEAEEMTIENWPPEDARDPTGSIIEARSRWLVTIPGWDR